MKLKWLESFELRVPEIDGDHRTMLVLMNLVQSSATSGRRQRVEHYLDRLITFCQSHFAREEALLVRWGYPDVKGHVTYHAGLLERTETLRQSCAKIETPEAFEKCCEELMSFLLDDVLSGDIQLKSFLEHAGLAVPVLR